MDSEKFSKQPKTVLVVSGISVETIHLDPDYILIVKPDSKPTPEGWLVILRVEPVGKNSLLPTFVARWEDEKKTNKEAIDVDLVNPETERQVFKDGRNGYQGHHTKTIGGKPRTFEIDIEIPTSRKIFHAQVNCSMLTRKVTFAADAFLKAAPSR
jgi:hypothetical protein